MHAGFERYSGVHVRQMGLTESQFDVVATLGNTSGMSCKALGENTHHQRHAHWRTRPDGGARSDHANSRLTMRGARNVALTSKGAALFEGSIPAHLQHLERAFGRLSQRNWNHLRSGLTQLQDAFERN